MPTLYRRPNGRWYVSFWRSGKQYRKSLHTADRRRAMRLFDDFEQNFHRSTLGIPVERPAPFIRDLFSEYLAFLKNHRSPATWLHAKLYVDKFLGPAFGHLRADQLTARHVEDFITQLTTYRDDAGRPAPYHPRTVNLRLGCLAAMLRRAVRIGSIPEMPCEVQKLRETRPLPKYITPEQFSAWISRLKKPMNRRRAIMAICTGIPDSELGRLTWEESYVKELHVLRYRRSKTGAEIIVRLNKWAQEVIQELWKDRDGPYIFHGVRDARKAYENASTASGIKVTPHMLRHSFATWSLSTGEPIAHISSILGHRDITTTQIYARVMPTFLFQATAGIDRLRPIDTTTKTPEKAISRKPCTPRKNRRTGRTSDTS